MKRLNGFKCDCTLDICVSIKWILMNEFDDSSLKTKTKTIQINTVRKHRLKKSANTFVYALIGLKRCAQFVSQSAFFKYTFMMGAFLLHADWDDVGFCWCFLFLWLSALLSGLDLFLYSGVNRIAPFYYYRMKVLAQVHAADNIVERSYQWDLCSLALQAYKFVYTGLQTTNLSWRNNNNVIATVRLLLLLS